MFFRAIVFTLVISLTACASETSMRGFKPPPEEFELWTNNGATTQDIMQTMLQCGYPHTWGEDKKTRRSDNEIALSENCMIKKGYKYRGRFGTICSPAYTKYVDGTGKSYVDTGRLLPACQTKSQQ